jgi:hypothetical protein
VLEFGCSKQKLELGGGRVLDETSSSCDYA